MEKRPIFKIEIKDNKIIYNKKDSINRAQNSKEKILLILLVTTLSLLIINNPIATKVVESLIINLSFDFKNLIIFNLKL